VRTTGGSRILSDHVPDQDATVVRRLRDAGAVFVGKANMLEFAYGEIHPDYGPSCNPWNLECGTSGSSSGSGAAVAAGLGYGSIGSDTGGSIRLPAAYCGIVGLKATYGRVSRAGVLPLSWSLDHVGPMTRTVLDCAIMLQAIAGHDPADPTSARQPVPDYPEQIGDLPADLVAGVVEPEEDDEVIPDVRRATDAAVETLRRLGIRTRPVRLPHPVQATRAALVMFYAEASAYHREWVRTRPDDFSPNMRLRAELGALIPATVYLDALRARRVVIEAYQALFREVDLLVMPTSPSASYRLDEPSVEPVSEGGERMGSLIRFSGPFDLTGLPAISVPSGITADGMPIGVQLAGRPFAEPALFQVAHAFERANAGHFVKPADNLLLA
jgi:aspartyl-tRNA(Asn)/glutamyl-tRNA(Gln) amidotransferase subunit A